MPKPKPDEVIRHEVVLGRSERNLLSGVAAAYEINRVLDPFVRERTRPLVEAMQRAVARHEIPPTVDLERAATLAGGPIITRVLFGGATDPDVVRQLVDLVAKALRAERRAC